MMAPTATSSTQTHSEQNRCSHTRIGDSLSCLFSPSTIDRLALSSFITSIRPASLLHPPQPIFLMIPRLFLLAIVYRSPLTEAQACAAGSAKQIKGNWYCSQVDAINYRNFPGHGTYNKITRMDPKTGTCDHEVFQYSGSLSPLNEEVSHSVLVHL